MPYRFNCDTCPRRCDGQTIGVYNFQNDAEYSEHFEQQIISQIRNLGYWAEKTQRPQYPDIEVYDRENGRLLCFIEVKAQRRTFMKVRDICPNGNLYPSETLALNQSDLEHYIAQSREETAPIFIMWVLSNRPCIVPDNEVRFFYNSIEEFERIFNYYQNRRRFRRRSGRGDVVNGQHVGVVVNYHFSLNELMPLNLQQFLTEKFPK